MMLKLLVATILFAAAVANEVNTNSLISNKDAANTSFRPQAAGEYEFQVTVTDGCSSFTDDVHYTVVCERPPEADAGDSQRITQDCSKSSTVYLDGSESRASGHVEYEWTFCGIPAESRLDDHAISHSNRVAAFFVPDVVGRYCVQLAVTDCCGTVTDHVEIEYHCGSAPTVDAGHNQQVELKQRADLDGSKSDASKEYDLTYKWEFLSRPSDSLLQDHDILKDEADNRIAVFYPDVKGSYVLQLTVSDCCHSASATVVVDAMCNDAPTANAGPDEEITGLQEVTLDGSASSDPDSDKLVYSWSFTNLPTKSALTDEAIQGFNIHLASFMPDVLGVYEVELTVSDCCSSCASRKKVVVGCNDAPQSEAGEDKTITGTRPFPNVELDGCDTVDPNDDVLLYNWSFVTVPDASRVTDKDINGGDKCGASFTPDVLGLYEAQLSTSDHCSVSNDTVRVIVGCNRFPEAHAGADQTIDYTCSPAQVNLDGSDSRDPDSDQLSFQWRFSSVPQGSELHDGDIDHSSEKWASFQPDVVGVYEVILSVSDSCTRDTDRVRIVYSCNRTPRAHAGPDRVVTGTFPWTEDVILDGTQSDDPDKDDFRYTWSVATVPEDSQLTSASILGPHQAMPSFRPDVAGRYEFEVTVSDCCSSSTDRVVIKVSCGTPPTANAGYDQYLVQDCATDHQVVEIDGSGSYDPDGNDLQYAWSFVSVPEGSRVDDKYITNANSMQASFTISRDYRVSHSDEYVLQLAVSDSCRTVYDQVKVTYCCNDKPTANAGVDFAFSAAPPFPPVSLNGERSSDPNDDGLAYHWSVVSAPQDSQVTDASVHARSSPNASFSPDVRGIYEMELEVSDCCTSVTDRVKITITCDNPPTPNAGPDRQIEHFCDRANTVDLDASGSYDVDKEALSFLWSFVAVPSDSAIRDSAILNPNHEKASFTPDVTGSYELSVTVSDGCSEVMDSVRVSYTCEGSPNADAGERQDIVSNPPFHFVHVSGAGSTDPFGSIQNYEWEFSSVPLGSRLNNADISHDMPTAYGASFAPDAPGCYDLQLTIFGCCAKSRDRTTVCITCNDAPTADAGKDQDFVKGPTEPLVELDGCGSNDPEDDVLTFGWRFTRKPSNSELDDSDIFRSTSCRSSFTPDTTGIYELELTAFDGCNPSRDKTLVKYRCNQTPVPDAGSDRSIVKSCSEASFVDLDGSGTVDPDDDQLNYRWSISRVPPGSTVTDDNISNATSVTATFAPDVFGLYELTLTASDYCFSVSDSVLVTYNCNGSPYANAGTDQDITAYPFPMINLFGTHSRDADGDELSYQWEFVNVPINSRVTSDNIIDSNQPRAIFMPDVAGVYVVSLTVNDCCSSSTDEVKITLNKKGCNQPPSADAGEDQSVIKMCNDNAPDCGEVTLDGSGSYDPDDDRLSFKWKFAKRPFESLLLDQDISYSNSDRATFTPDFPGEYLLVLDVTDGCSNAASEVKVTYTCNSAPVAYAGEDRREDSGNNDLLPDITVDASGSYDPDGDSLTYKWEFLNKADGSCLTDGDLDCSNGRCHFVPDVRGCFELQLTASDCCNSNTDTVQVCITCSSTPIPYAGEDQMVRECPPYSPVFLKGSDEAKDGDPSNHSWKWKFARVPADSKLVSDDINNWSSADSSFVPDVRGVYEVELSINDGCSSDVDHVEVVVGCNSGPSANAGHDVSVRWDGSMFPKVVLDGSSSTDPEEDELSFQWKFTQVPNSSKLSDRDISANGGSIATFWADTAGTYEIELTVMDCCSPSVDRVLVHVGCNGVPSVSAGEGQTIKKSCKDSVAVLQGSAIDPDGDRLTYGWHFTNIPPGSKLTDNKLSDANALTSSFVPDVTGSFFELTFCASDGCTTLCDRVKIEFECNDPPQANAGPDQALDKECTETTVHLDGSGSVDPDGDPLLFSWRFTNIPAGSTLVNDSLLFSDTSTPQFVPDVTGIYELEVTVKDCCEIPALRCTCMKDRVLVTLSCRGGPPKPVAGENQVINWDESFFPTVHLDGSQSTDPDHDHLEFVWSFLSLPDRSKLTNKDIDARESSNAFFVPDVNGEYDLEMCVSDCCYRECSYTHVVVRCDNPPITRAGPDQSLTRSCQSSSEGSPVFLDGSGSSDPDEELLECQWRFICKPAQSLLSDGDIQNNNQANAFFYADVLGEYVLELACYDGCSWVADEMIAHVACNDKPKAVARTAGGLQTETITEDCGDNELVVLDGSATSDVDGDPLHYRWSFVSKPTESKLTNRDILGGFEAIAKFRADAVGEYVVQLDVEDCCQSDSAIVTINVQCSEPPVPNAGKDQEVGWDGISALTVTLDGSQSEDADTENLRYRWTLVNKPEESTMTQGEIFDSEKAKANFDPDDFGCFDFKLEVSDCCATLSSFTQVCVVCSNATHCEAGENKELVWTCDSDFDLSVAFDGDADAGQVSYEWELVSFNRNSVPHVDAGCDYEGVRGRAIHLDSAHIHDPEDSNGLSVTWTFSQKPGGSYLTDRDIIARHNRLASFVPDVTGQYVVKLSVSDGETISSDFATVEVYENNGGFFAEMQETDEVFHSNSSGDSWKVVAYAAIGVAGLCMVLLVTVLVVYRKTIARDVKRLGTRTRVEAGAEDVATTTSGDKSRLLRV